MKNNTTQIKEKIPHGGIKIIAGMAGTTIFTASRVVNGKSENAKVKKAITQYLKQLSKEENDFKKAINPIK